MKVTISSFLYYPTDTVVSICHEFHFIWQGRGQHETICGLIDEMKRSHQWHLNNPNYSGFNPWKIPFPESDIEETKYDRCAYVDKRTIDISLQ